METAMLWRIGDAVQMAVARVGVVVYFLCVAALIVIPVCMLCGCPAFTLSDVNTGVTAGRTFEDGGVFNSGKTVWSVNVNGHWTRNKEGK